VTEARRQARVQAARFAFTRILADSPAIDIALAHVLEAIAANLGWQVAEIWLPDMSDQRLRQRGTWHIADHPEIDRFAATSHNISFAHGEGLPGQAWVAGEVIWEQDLLGSPTFRRASLAAAAGLRTAVGVPIMRDHEPLGVMLFFSQASRPIEASLKLVLTDLGGQLGQFVARKEAEHTLRAERAQLAQRVALRTADLGRANADLARAVRAKDEFLANMSHELRTPLNTILALSEVLLEQIRGPLNERQQDSLRSIEASGQHLLTLINDILDLSKVEAGRLDLVLEPVSLAEICQMSLMFVKELALKKQLQLDFQLNDERAMMNTDAKRLKQMLVNLLSNAVKFTPPGGTVSLLVDIRPATSSICFRVRDTGIGITPDDQARLFQPFTQIESNLQRHHEGTGLGLALVRRLANLHGGSVGIESALGQGSCFTITLPYQSPRQQEAAQPSEFLPIALAEPAEVAHPALIIDDSESATDQLARYLEALHIEAVVFPRGADALEQAIQLQPRVIFLDLLLPSKSGWEILRQLKADPRTRDIPVIIVSVVDERAKGLAAGASAYLVKPLARQELRKALRAATAPEAGRRQTPTATPQPAARSERAHILLADDNPSNIAVISEYLREHGYPVDVARNGQEALERAAQVPPDLFLLDVQMPTIDGLEVVRRLRRDPEFAATPIIMLTALAMAGDRERCLASGANEYLTKPLSLKQLVETIRRLLA
ncbi:MAG: response regulator, partial [Oscillochloris sp.]|nr:response regulator [Oscillochloris sp.]